MKKIAIFDIDGTFFRSSLLIELTEALIKEGIFPAKTRDIYTAAFQRWFNRKGSYDAYIGTVIKAFEKNIVGVPYHKFVKVTKKVIASNQNRVYRYTRDLIRDLKKRNYYLLAISHSPKVVVDEFCKKWGFNKNYARLYEVGANGKFTGKTLYQDLIKDKAKILERAITKEGLTLANSLGMGDSEGDITFLQMVAKPICFNPNSILYQHAKKAKWEVVVERKDVIYHLPHTGEK